MLKNKFSMLKVLALALSVLMLVSLAACGGKGVAEDDMNAAIQAALSEQAAADASKQAALESSLAAAQAATESERKAAESSLAAAAAEASRVAAEASKAASEAEEKASIEASKVAASIAASISKSQEDAAKTSQATTAPIVADKNAIAAVQAEFAKLKHEFVVVNASYYLADDYAELALMFDKAAVELQNALTKEAAENVLATLKVEAAAIKNVKADAAAVQALIVGLGDVETGVFTTVYEKTEEAWDALYQMLFDYAKYFDTEFEDKEDKRVDEITDYDVDAVEDLGVDLDRLAKAEAKIEVLKAYIASTLSDSMKALYLEYELDFDEEGDDLFTATGAKDDCYDLIADAYYKYLVLSIVNGGDVAEADVAIEWDYLYDEDTGKVVKAKANSSYETPWLYGADKYEEGDKVYDLKAETAWFTAEEFMEIFATPYLNVALKETTDKAVDALADALIVARGVTTPATVYANINTIAKNSYIAEFDNVEDALEEIFDKFEAEMEELTFVGDYKGNATLADAQIDVWTKYVEAYLAAGNAIIEASKLSAVELYAEQYEEDVEALNEQYEDKTGANAAATLDAKLKTLADKKVAFEANVEATPVYTYEDLFDVELLDKYEAKYDEDDFYYDLTDYITENGVEDEMIDYIEKLIAGTMNANFKGSKGTTQTGMLGDLVYALTDDLLALRDRLDPTNDDSDLYWAYKGRENVTLQETAELEGYRDDKYYANIPAFLELVGKIDAAIEAMEAIDENTFEDKDVTLKVRDDESTYGTKNYKQPIYWLNETAKGLALEKWDEQDEIESAVLQMLNDEAERLGKGKDNAKITMAEYVTLNNTGLPVTYVYTATEQACMAARDLYDALWKEIHAALLSQSGFVGTYKGKVNSTAYKNTLKLVSTNADLKAEMEAVATLYQGYMDTYSAYNYAFSTDAGTKSYVNAFSKSDYIGTTGNHITNNTAKVGNNTANYWIKDGVSCVTDDLQEYVDLFNATYFVKGDNTKSTLIDLWTYKTEMVAELTALKASYKNEYKTSQKVVDGYLQTVTERIGATKADATTGKYVYDEGLTAPSTKGAAYEAQVDALFDSYIAKIEAVTLTTVAEVKDVKEVKILTKWGVKNFDINGDGEFAVTEKFEKVAFNVAAACELIDAYVVDLVGAADAAALGVVLDDTAVEDLTGTAGYEILVDKISNYSRIEKAFDVYYRGQYQ